MEENDKKSKIEEKIDKGSNSCVIDLPIDEGNGVEEIENKEKNEIDNSPSLNKSFDDILNFTKKLNLKDNFENILDISNEERTTIDEQNKDVRKTRSKTFKIKKSSDNKAPRPQQLIIDEYIRPLKLNSSKSIIMENSQKDLVECKSCDDKSDNEKNYINYFSNDDSEDEARNTQINKIDRLKSETKQLLFNYKVNCKYYNEYENILNIEKIFWKNIHNNRYDDILIGKNKNIQNREKRKFWQKHINGFKKQLNSMKILEEKNGKEIFEFRKKRSDTFSKKNNSEGLFILGVLESAAKDKKRRKTMHSKRIIKNVQKVEDEK
jgi:hypothetical protein